MAQWGVGLNAKCPKKAGSPGTVFIFFFLKASIGLGKQGDELRKSGSRAGWDPPPSHGHRSIRADSVGVSEGTPRDAPKEFSPAGK